MFDVIRKLEYFDCLNENFASKDHISLKGIQDGWTLRELSGTTNKRIMEMGGGNSRILAKLEGNKLWNVDKFEGIGQGPTEIREEDGVEVVKAFMGEFSSSVPQVDIIFSISVIEHIPFEGYGDAFLDMARCLIPGGTMIHTIDLPLADIPLSHSDTRISLLSKSVEKAGLQWRVQPKLMPGTVFTSDMASHSDLEMWKWIHISKDVKRMADHNQLVSIKMIADKPNT